MFRKYGSKRVNELKEKVEDIKDQVVLNTENVSNILHTTVESGLPGTSINTVNNNMILNFSSVELTPELRAVKLNLTVMVDSMLRTVTKEELIGLWENINDIVENATPNMKMIANTIQFKDTYEPNFLNAWANVSYLMPSFKAAKKDLWLDKTNEQTAVMLSGFTLLLQGMINANLVLAPLAVEKMSKTWFNANPAIVPFALSEGVELCMTFLKNVLANEYLYKQTGYDRLQQDLNLYATAWNIATTYTAQIMLGITGETSQPEPEPDTSSD